MRAIFPSIPRLCVYVCVCRSVYCRGVCMYSWWGEQEGAMSPSTLGEFNCEMHIEVACTHSYHHFLWSEKNCFCACLLFFFLSKMSLGVTRGTSEPSKRWQVMQYLSCGFWYVLLNWFQKHDESWRWLYTAVKLSVCTCYTLIFLFKFHKMLWYKFWN